MLKVRKRIFIWMTFQGWLKIFFSIGLIMALGYTLTYELSATRTWTYWTIPLSGKVIALDAGHGGADGGAVSNEGLIEKDVSLGITLYLRDYLQQAGALVVMTRETDKDLAESQTHGSKSRKTEDLHRRAKLIEAKKSDLLISVHLNSIPSSRWSGAQTFYHESSVDSQFLATLIQDELKRNLLNTDRLARTDNTIYLLKSSKIPAALVEIGFLSNPEEARLMGQTSYQQKVAAAIYQGILRYLSVDKLGTS